MRQPSRCQWNTPAPPRTIQVRGGVRFRARLSSELTERTARRSPARDRPLFATACQAHLTEQPPAGNHPLP